MQLLILPMSNRKQQTTYSVGEVCGREGWKPTVRTHGTNMNTSAWELHSTLNDPSYNLCVKESFVQQYHQEKIYQQTLTPEMLPLPFPSHIYTLFSTVTWDRSTFEILDLSSDILDGGQPLTHNNHTLPTLAGCPAT